jgi:hypothetical protein
MRLFSQARNEAALWPSHWNIRPILDVRHPVYHSRPFRMIRRLAKKWTLV